MTAITFIVCGFSVSRSSETLSLKGGMVSPSKSMNASIPVTASKIAIKCQSVRIYRIIKINVIFFATHVLQYRTCITFLFG